MGLSVHDPFVDPLGNPLGLARQNLPLLNAAPYLVIDFTSSAVVNVPTAYKKARFTIIGSGGDGQGAADGRGGQGGSSAVSEKIPIKGILDFTFVGGATGSAASSLTLRDVTGAVFGTLTAPGGASRLGTASIPGSGTPGFFSRGFAGGLGGNTGSSNSSGRGGGGAAGPEGKGGAGGGSGSGSGAEDGVGGSGGGGRGGAANPNPVPGYGGGGLGGKGALGGLGAPHLALPIELPSLVLTNTSALSTDGGVGGGGGGGGSSSGNFGKGGVGMLRLELWLN
ncbi:hypothetical protein SAMN04490192_2865 [Pseudomonas lundensis]|nr:hypothetical protein SAMN04490192_2865 [Pseudomonas lundensis]